MNIILKRTPELSEVSFLVVAIAGEIGNNAFDHNLGNWRDEAGTYLFYSPDTRCVVIADRGAGVQTTLKRVRPEIQNDCEALTIAFKEIVTSRAPERRGNGLKLVERMVLSQDMKLDLYSGAGHYSINHGKTACLIGGETYGGVIAILKF